jgi:hypothetical protein
MVTFSEDGVTFGTPVAMTAGKASLTTSALAVGPHSILMSYSGDLADNPSSNTVTQVVTKTASSTALVVTGSQTIGATLTLTATVSGAGVTPTGAVTFNDGATTLGTGPLVSGIATFQTNKLALGQHNLTAVYAGSPNYAGSASSTVVVNIQQPVVTVELTASSQELLQGSSDTFTATLKAPSGSPAPTGTITFTDGATTLATKTLPLHTFSTSSLALGEHIIVATYNGNLGSASDSVIVFIYSGTQTITLTTLTSTAVQFANGTFHVPFRMNGSPQTAGSVVFTAFVQGGTTPAITGAVQFYDDDVALGNPVTLDGTQHANLTWNQFALGKHRIFAVYVPDNSTYSGSVSVESPQTDIYRDPTPLNLQH